MIKVRVRTAEGKIVEEEIDFSTLEKWVKDGILTADDEVWSDILTGGVWKRIGDLTFFKRIILEKQGAGSLTMGDVISRGSFEQARRESIFTQQEIRNKLAMAKILGGVSIILMFISGIFTLFLLGYGLYFLFNISGLVLFAIAMKYISDAVNEPSIFRDILIYIFGSIAVAIISVVIGVGTIISLTRRGLFDFDFLQGTIGGAVVVIILMYIGMIIMFYYLRKALVTTAQELNISLFKVSGDLLFWGWVTIVILVGGIITLIGNIILMVAFFSIKEDIPSAARATSSIQFGIKYCSNCGSRLSHSDRFCPNCGKRQEE